MTTKKGVTAEAASFAPQSYTTEKALVTAYSLIMTTTHPKLD